MSFLQSFSVRFPLLLLCSGTMLIGTAHLAAQAPPESNRASESQAADERTPRDTMANSAPGATSAYSAWNDLLRDAARMGLMAAARSGGAGNNAVPSTGMQAGPNASVHGGSGGLLNINSLFQLAGDASRGLTGSGHSSLGSALGVIPMLSQLTRGGVQLPVGSSFGSFRVSYQSPLSFSGMNGSSIAMRGYGSGAAAYNSPHVRSGRVDFSASAVMGMGSNGATGSPGGGMGQGGSSGHGGPCNHAGSNQSDPSASVSLHLSF